MTLEAVVHQQLGRLGGSSSTSDGDSRHLCSLLENWDFNSHEQDHNSPTRRRARRRRSTKNQEDIESQRMTHIAVERNRRKQMNEYFSVLKSLMPHSYSQRGDQASVVGGAINTVKELEHSFRCLSAHNMEMTQQLPFGEVFSFPQYYSTANNQRTYGEPSRVADIEATMVERHVNLNIRSRKRPKQLLKLLSGIQEMSLSILHLNVITADPFALYSLSVKVEDGSQLNTADEIATAVHQLLCNN